MGLLKLWMGIREYIRPRKELPNLSVVPPIGSEQTLESSEASEAKHGCIRIIGSVVHAADPNEHGIYPTLSIPEDENLVVYINNEVVVGRRVVSEQDAIGFSLSQSTGRREYHVDISDDSMQVKVRAKVVIGTRRNVEDVQSTLNAVLKVTEEPAYPETGLVSDITGLLDKLGLTGTLDFPAMTELCSTRETIERIVLRGLPSQPGSPAKYIPLQKRAEVHLDGRPNLTSGTVTAGTPVARVTPGLPSIEGRDVYGKTLSAPAIKESQRLGPGILQINDRLIATRDGRFVITKAKVDVIPEMVISHDVEARNGDIAFDGNLVIHGSVLDGVKIRCTGTVTVYGDVCHAQIRAERGLFITGNIVGSSLIAGYTVFQYFQFKNWLKELLSECNRFLSEYTICMKRALERPDSAHVVPMLAPSLFEKRYGHLQEQLDHFLKKHADLSLWDKDFSELSKFVPSKFFGIYRSRMTENDVLQLSKMLTDYINNIEKSMSAEKAVISAKTASTSSIVATGNIKFSGAGVFSCTLESKGSISLHEMRGGFAVAKRCIRIHELGSPQGVEASVQVDDRDGKIQINIRHPNTLVSLAGQRSRNWVTEYSVHLQPLKPKGMAL